MIIIKIISFFPISECQSYGSLNSGDRLRTKVADMIVTMESDLVGFVSRGPPVQECQLHVHLPLGVKLLYPVG